MIDKLRNLINLKDPNLNIYRIVNTPIEILNKYKIDNFKEYYLQLLKKIRVTNTSTFIYKSELIHGSKYDYSLVNYINTYSDIEIVCKTHGSFFQRPLHHLQGKGCIKCSGVFNYSTNEFISKSKLIHGNKYDYSLVNYINNNSKVEIVCKTHGSFFQQPYHHLQGMGCLKCSFKISRQEVLLKELLDTLSVQYVQNDRSIIKPFEIDFFLPDYNIGIELNGLKWHSTKFKHSEKHVSKKHKLCKRQNIELFTFFEDEVIDNYKHISSIKNKKLSNKFVQIIKSILNKYDNTAYDVSINKETKSVYISNFISNDYSNLFDIYDKYKKYEVYIIINKTNDYLKQFIDKLNKKLIKISETNFNMYYVSDNFSERVDYPSKYSIFDNGTIVYKFK